MSDPLHSPVHLGLGPSPKPFTLYVSTEHNPVGWHGWDHHRGEPIIIDEPAVTGYVRAVGVVERERRGEMKPKLNIQLAAGQRNYIIEAGLDTHFSRSVLAAMARLEHKHFKRALTIVVEPGDRESKVVFGNLYFAELGHEVRTQPHARDKDVDVLLEHVRATLAEDHIA